MDDLQERIESVLNDPQQMQEILSLARSLGVELPDAGAESAEKARAEAEMPPTPPSLPQGLGGAMAQPVAELLKEAGKLEKKQENLLNALKPFLKPNRREKIDRAMQAARLSHLAGYALKSRNEKNQP